MPVTQADRDILKFVEKYGGITIKIASKVFYPDKLTAYDNARKRLKRIYHMRLLKCFTDRASSQKVYYIDKQLGPHRLRLLEFYACLLEHKAQVLEFKVEPGYLNNKVKGDGFFEFVYNKKHRLLIVEIDYTSARPLDRWERVYEGGEIQKAYKGAFPSIVLVGSPRRQYKGSKPINFINMTFELDDFVQKILTI